MGNASSLGAAWYAIEHVLDKTRLCPLRNQHPRMGAARRPCLRLHRARLAFSPTRAPTVGRSAQACALALDQADRLMPALDTESGIPFGSINLRRGVAATESPVACTAAAGTLVMEFGALSRLTGNASYEAAAKRAALAVWRRRSELDLLGAHVHLKSGQWTQADAGIGRSIDSFYEYMLKGFMLLGDTAYLAIFHDSYHAALSHLKHGPWYLDVHLQTAQVTWPLFNSLQCFWPGMQMLIGELDQAVETLRAFHTLWRHLGFHPEGFNLASMQVQTGQKGYPLRPEHVESLFWAHRSLQAQGHGGHEWLRAGMDVLSSLERLRLPCGYAAVSDLMNGTLEDKMESFFLSETLKYLYLLRPRRRDHSRSTLTTEAHLPRSISRALARHRPRAALPCTHRQRRRERRRRRRRRRGGGARRRRVRRMRRRRGGESHRTLEDEDDGDEAAQSAKEAEEAANLQSAPRRTMSCALAQLQGLPHPDDEFEPAASVDSRNAALMESLAEEEAQMSSMPRLVGSCALPSEKVRDKHPQLAWACTHNAKPSRLPARGLLTLPLR